MTDKNEKMAYFKHDDNGFDIYLFPFDTFSKEEAYAHAHTLKETEYPKSPIIVHNYTDAVVVRFDLQFN